MPATQSRVFIARLAGLAAFDPEGDQIGKVRDVVVSLLGDHLPPRVVGLVLEVPPRRRVFVPITRVTALDAGSVIITGLVNMRRFDQRPTETLVIGELLDRTATRLDTGQEITLADVAMTQDRSRDWSLTKVHVRSKGSGFRRRGETATLDWNMVSGLSLPQSEQAADFLLASLSDMHVADIAAVLGELTSTRRLDVVRALDDERLADVLGEMTEDEAIAIVAMLEGERAADVIEEMNPDDAADILSEMSPELAADLLERMEPEDAADIRRLMSYGDYTAGGMMTTEPVILDAGATVAEALARVRNPEIPPSLASQVYVVRSPTETPTGHYLGVAHIQRLLREPPSSLVSAVLDTDLEPLGPDAPLSTVTRHFATYNLVALPVVDDSHHLIGAVTVDDVIDHMLPENWRQGGAEGGSDG